jgi:hypothetical protein
MSRALLIIAMAVFADSGVLMAQAREMEMMVNRKTQNAVAIEVEEPAKSVERKWAAQFEQGGCNPKKSKGVYHYNRAALAALGGDTMHVYTRVESIGRTRCRLYVSAARPDGTIITEEGDSLMAQKMKKYLYDFIARNNYNSMDLEIQRYVDSVAADEANYNAYAQWRKKLEDQRHRISKQLVEIDDKYKKEKDDWATRKQRLEEMKRQRESKNNN